MAFFLGPADYWWSWGDLVFRWLHVVAAIAWIGSSFYFIALDHHLEPPTDPRDAARGVGGEVW
ncbi:MAG TPA: urate hydroxylase PuuD, partial [Gaiellaceae bacterium]